MENSNDDIIINLDEVGISDDFDDNLEGEKHFNEAAIVADKPKETDWFRVYGSALTELKDGICVNMANSTGKSQKYYVHGKPAFVKSVKDDFKKGTKIIHAFFKTSYGRYGIWPVSKFSSSQPNGWAATAQQILKLGQTKWVRVVSNMADQHYECFTADDGFAPLTWEVSYGDAIQKAWTGRILHEGNYNTHPDVKNHIRKKVNLSYDKASGAVRMEEQL
jgi:hypothetical protein|tara:strand:+ start:382 stop:1041 length:660 start_codon:yes stop_codon:yes gene_type:complete